MDALTHKLAEAQARLNDIEYNLDVAHRRLAKCHESVKNWETVRNCQRQLVAELEQQLKGKG